MELRQVEKIAKALGDLNRLRILAGMAASGGQIQCSRILQETELAQPSVSHHIKTLVDAGLIEAAKEGRNYNYSLNKKVLEGFMAQLSTLSGLDVKGSPQ